MRRPHYPTTTKSVRCLMSHHDLCQDGGRLSCRCGCHNHPSQFRTPAASAASAETTSAAVVGADTRSGDNGAGAARAGADDGARGVVVGGVGARGSASTSPPTWPRALP